MRAHTPLHQLLLLVALLPGCLCAAAPAATPAHPWRCDVPSRPGGVVDKHLVLGWDGTNPYCLSRDGTSCLTEAATTCQQQLARLAAAAAPAGVRAGATAAPPMPAALPRPFAALVCGKALRAATGSTGYETNTTWCSIARAALSAPARACLARRQAVNASSGVCLPGAPGGAACARHGDCGSARCVFRCGGGGGRCAYCARDSDCPAGSACWVSSAEPAPAGRAWLGGPALPMCGLTCSPALGHVCSCGEALAPGTARPCPRGFYCEAPSYGDGCGPPPDTAFMSRCG